MTARAAFLDRDGVLNERPPLHQHITDLEDFNILPGAAEATQALTVAGFVVVLVSNQRGVKGVALDLVERELLNAGVIFDAAYYCPHGHADDCECRKPKAGMLTRAAKELDLDLFRSTLIGDTPSDIAAGNTVGCYTIRIGPHRGRANAVAAGVFDAAFTAIQWKELAA